MREYYIAAVEMLQAQQEPTEVDGAPVILKKSPSEPRDGYLDHDELAIMKNHWIAREQGEEPEVPPSPEEAIQAMRDSMGFPNRNLCTVEIHTKFETLNIGGNEVGLWRYYPRTTQREKNRPCFIFLHGGGWVGGTPYTVENPCRLIAQLANAVVFNVDYALAPEKKYPNGFNDCYGVVEHIFNNADFYGIDKNRIGVGGDSAGGNLTAAIALKDRDRGTHMVALQVLMYACVTMVNLGVPDYKWSIGAYEIAEEQRSIIDPCLGISRPKSEDDDAIQMENLYFDDPKVQAREPYASPLLAESLEGLPTMLSVACEYDGLRIQDELYAKKAAEAGVKVKSIRYKGVTHAFIDRLGFVPQAEDLCIEIANAINAM